MLEQAPGRTCDLVKRGAHTGVGLLEGPVSPMLEQSISKELHLWNGSMLEQILKNCSLWEGPTLEKFMEDCLLWEGPQAEAGEECEEEGVAETTCDDLPFPLLFALIGGRNERNRE